MISKKLKISHLSRAQIILCIIILVYTVLALVGLGSYRVPVTQPDMGDGAERGCMAYAAFEAPFEIDSLIVYKGLGTCGITVYIPSESGDSWIEVTRQVCDSIYAWERIPLGCTAELICVSIGADAQAELFEIGFLSSTGEVIAVLSDGSALFDEQALVPDMPDYQNGMYFDEIFHARTAYEHINGLQPYEISHPPLGKLLISVGILLFGMNPFGWRIAGCICGIAMLPVLYVLAKKLFGKETPALAAAAFLSLDFMHFTQTRVALIDAPAVLLIMLMFTLMYRYYNSTPQDLPYKAALQRLALCGCVMGLGIAVKWTAVYAAFGLAILFVLAAVRRHRMGENTLRICLWCVLFFGVVPFLIYFLSYIPYFAADPQTSPWKIFWDNQIYMLTYHSGLDASHSFSSPWYSWPLMLRPICYYASESLIGKGLSSSITAFGNPIIWWCGSLCVLLLLFKRKKTREDVFILIGFAVQYLPWILISRITFIYHYFTCVPFIILALIRISDDASAHFKRCRYLLPSLLIGAAVLFVMFYPVLSGVVTSSTYADNILSWLPGWQFVY